MNTLPISKILEKNTIVKEMEVWTYIVVPLLSVPILVVSTKSLLSLDLDFFLSSEGIKSYFSRFSLK